MMNDPSAPGQPSPPPAGLCLVCRHARLVVSDRGSRFVRCTMADRDPAWPRYPRLPVRSCEAHEPVAAG